MILTEEEAKKKWCPFAQIAEISKFNNREEITVCCGSTCMMWCPINNHVNTGMCGLTISMQMGLNVNLKHE